MSSLSVCPSCLCLCPHLSTFPSDWSSPKTPCQIIFKFDAVIGVLQFYGGTFCEFWSHFPLNAYPAHPPPLFNHFNLGRVVEGIKIFGSMETFSHNLVLASDDLFALKDFAIFGLSVGCLLYALWPHITYHQLGLRRMSYKWLRLSQAHTMEWDDNQSVIKGLPVRFRISPTKTSKTYLP